MGNKTIVELYASLCARHRRLNNVEPMCKWCGAPYSGPHQLPQCSGGCFEAANGEERKVVRESIELIEKLFEINRWEL